MNELKLNGTIRTESGKNVARRMRATGKIPANLISDGKSSLISVEAQEFNGLLNHGLRQSSIFELQIDGKNEKVFVKELTREPIKGRVLHADFYRVTPGKKVTVPVAVEHHGTAKGVKAGGALEQFINSIKVKATPESLQDVLRIDITNLDVGDAIYLKDLAIPESWDVLLEGNPLVLKIARSRMARTAETSADTPAKTEASKEASA